MAGPSNATSLVTAAAVERKVTPAAPATASEGTGPMAMPGRLPASISAWSAVRFSPASEASSVTLSTSCCARACS